MGVVESTMMDFGVCLKMLLKERGVSASELARTLGYKSRNTVFRILDGEGGYASRKAFYDRLIEQDPLKLSDAERDVLDMALEVSWIGADAYRANRALDVLFANRDTCRQMRVACSADTNENRSLEQVFETLAQARSVCLQITGCCQRAVFEALRRMTTKCAACSVQIVHYIYTGPEEIIGNMAAIQPMLYDACYSAYAIEPGVYSPERERLYRSNCIYAHMERADGSCYDDVLTLVDEGLFVRLGPRDSGGFKIVSRLLGDERLVSSPIKIQFGMEDTMQGMSGYMQALAQMERNNAIYMVKPDIPLAFVNPDIMRSAFCDGFMEAGGSFDREEIKVLIDKLYALQLSRWENMFVKRKPTHVILSRSAMEAFAQTGKMSDHFFGFRPYTRQERVQILSQLREQAVNHPSISLSFFRNDIRISQFEIALYEGVGVLMTKPYTDYDLSGDHAEALVVCREFGQRFKAYYCHDLMERKAIGKEEALSVMDALIEMARQS